MTATAWIALLGITILLVMAAHCVYHSWKYPPPTAASLRPPRYGLFAFEVGEEVLVGVHGADPHLVVSRSMYEDEKGRVINYDVQHTLTGRVIADMPEERLRPYVRPVPNISRCGND